jgi:bifunctional DNA-binding transcriptional regulator/antitoxin component of YhaV-PrlF toxin-antitoxin module|tara:strand:- start:368 stop:607 length:240 start_codon:yes stop_codon:yes gene_type:complete
MEEVKAERTCKVSSKNQVTIPVAALAETGIHAGDRLIVRPDGPGRVVLVLEGDPIAEFAGALTHCFPPGILDKLRDEWD